MMEAARDFHAQTGPAVGVKVAGGVRTSKQAIQYLVAGPRDARPGLDDARRSSGSVRSTLLNDVLMQINKERTGRYQGPDYFTID